MLKKVLITGASGQLGNAVCNQLKDKYELLATDIIKTTLDIPFVHLDITNAEQITDVLNKYMPDVILNLAAYTDVDGCELNPKMAYDLNTESVKLLSNNFNGQFIQISTDYVFDGQNGPYSENDKTNPLNRYGETKLFAEKLLEDNIENYCILRTNVLFDYFHGTNASFIKWVIDSLKSKKSITIVADQWNNPTWTSNFAEIIELGIDNNTKGLYHYGGAEYLNRFEFALIIANVFNLDQTLLKPISTESLNQTAPRPLKGGLKTEKIEQEFSIDCIKLIDSLNAIKSRIGL